MEPFDRYKIKDMQEKNKRFEEDLNKMRDFFKKVHITLFF